MEYLREDDILVVTKPCRLARSAPDLLKKVGELKDRGIALRILSMRLDTSDMSPTGKLMLTVLAAVGEFEREIMLERQLDGIAKAKAEGKFKGRAPTARAKSKEVKALEQDGLNPAEIARRVGIGRASVYRIIRAEA
jgi:DNA invertase Pin-like site-specific DNA recombinase